MRFEEDDESLSLTFLFFLSFFVSFVDAVLTTPGSVEGPLAVGFFLN